MRACAPSASWYASALAAATPCGARVVYGSDRTLVVVRARTGEVVAIVRTAARIHAVCCIGVGKSAREDDDDDDGGDGGDDYGVVCALADKTLRVFDLASLSFDASRTLRGGHTHEATSCCAFGVGGVASACRNGVVALWRVHARGANAPISTHKVMDGAITVIAASAGPSGVIAVGGANGTVCALDVARGTSRRRAASGFGEITALAWTMARDGSGLERELLAVGTRERKVTIWTLEDDGSLTTTHALHLPKPSAPLSEAQRGRVWVAVAWIPEPPKDNDNDASRDGGDYRAPRLITSGQGGDLLSWRVPMKTDAGDVVDVKDAQTFGPRDAAHTRTIFTITVIPPSSATSSMSTTCVSTGLDRKVVCWDVDALERRWSFDALGGFVYDISIDARDPFSVIFSCGDGTVHAWDCSPTLASGVRACLLWKGLPNTKVTSVAKCPGGDVAAFGLEDGRVGCFDIASGKFALYPECHGGAVHTLAWFDIRSGDDEGEEEEEGLMTLTSASADGGVWRWLDTFNPATTADVKKSGVLDARKYGKYLDLGKLYGGAVDDGGDNSRAIDAFEYSPRRGLLALGWSSGELSAHDFGQERWRCREHVKGINCVRWHPESDDDSSAYASWLVSASKSGCTLVHGPGGVVACALPKHAVLDMSWSPRKGCAILACAQHGCVKVWSFEGATSMYRATALANFSGHVGKVLCVRFAAYDDETVVSGGDDKTFRVWNYTDAECSIDESTSATAVEISTAGDASACEQENSGKTSNAGGTKSSSKKSSSAKSKKLKGSSTVAFSGAFFKPDSSENTSVGIAEGQRAAVTLANRMYKAQGKALEREAFTFGPRGIAPYAETDAAMEMLASEATALANMDEIDTAAHERGLEKAAALHMYRGDYAGAASLILSASNAPISSELMSLFIGGGHDVWSVVANAQCERLVDAGEYQRAALLRLSLHDVCGAIRTLRRGGLIRDAAALAAARLLPTDALLLDVRRELAAAEEARGGMEATAKAHLAVGAPAAAVRALTRLDRGGAHAAAQVVVACGLSGTQERRTVIRAVVELAEMDDFAAALETFEAADDALDVTDGYVRDIVRLERAFASANIDEFHDILTSMPNDAVMALTRPESWLEYSLSRRQRRHRRLALARAIFRDIARAYEFDVNADQTESAMCNLAMVPIDAHDAHDVNIATTSSLLADASPATDGEAATLARSLATAHHADADADADAIE